MTNTNSVTHSSTTEFAPTRYYDSLDSLRGIAAILVFFYHISFKTFLSHIALIEKGYLMVDFFFILSGFVITHSYEHRLKNFHEAKFFILKRFSRLYPLHLLMLLLYLGLEFFKYFYEIRTGITSNVPAFTQSNTLTFVSNLFLTHAL